ncbi:MAG: alpha/beta hydrolase-fold protein [Nakamurella sp.]
MGLNIAGGWFPLVLLVVGIAILLTLLVGRGRSWWLWRVPIAVVTAVVLTTAVTLYANHVWHPFADALPGSVVLWLGLTLLALGLAVVRRASVTIRVCALIGVIVVGVCGAAQVNAGFGAYPTLGALLGQPLKGEVDSSSVIGQPASPVPTTAGTGPLNAGWTAPVGLPAVGVVTTVPIPGTISTFPANGAWIYLPPAYQASPRPLLPVLILLAGQPGDARNWFDGGQAAQTMDAYAAAHHGLAPVVVVPDWVGNTNGNPMCVDSAGGGNDYTYLTQDVPNWIRANLVIDPRPTRWAVGGLSAGATCALQLATNDPVQFPNFLFFSGQIEPTLSDRATTVSGLFGGNEAGYVKINPMDIMKSTSFPASAGMFVVGDQDPDYGPQTQQVYAAAKAAGMAVELHTVPGGHEFPVWAAALSSSMDWLGTRLGLTG